MKKLLALVLALVMTLSLATVGTNAFTDDAQVKNDYAEAVQVLTGMNVFKGYTDNSFKPLNDITRAEVAAIVYRIYTADVNDKQASVYAGYGKFDDVNTASWYAGYVGYCTNAGFIKGYGDGKFGPNDKVTGYQALAMILRAVGYGKNGEFEGKDWELHVAQVAQQIGALVNVKGESLKAPASRQLVAELLFQCLQAAQVVYTPAFGYAPVSIIAGQKSLGEKNFNLKYSYNSDV
ncbi:MAG: S-layer homology domain-containing protein, partial [Oscillospiraceae bacterium]|nr:S-layer homology domain-containing protein [Oscillospiraceae bacterium]